MRIPQAGVAAAAVALLWAPPPAAGQVVTLSEKNATWTNPDCAATASCDLKEARFRARDYKVLVGGSYSYGTGFSAHYRTGTHASLERYGFVQWIRGCTFESSSRSGNIEIHYSVSREFYGGTIPFRHPRWVFDSVDTDPFYNSSPEHPRHHLYQWNRVPGSIQKATRVFYGQEKPPTPELYVLDYPGTAFEFAPGEAKSISLEFKTCLYKTTDVPASRPAEEVDLPGALVCFEWFSSHLYNHATGKFETRRGLHPACEDPSGVERLPAEASPGPPRPGRLLESAAASLSLARPPDFDGNLIPALLPSAGVPRDP